MELNDLQDQIKAAVEDMESDDRSVPFIVQNLKFMFRLSHDEALKAVIKYGGYEEAAEAIHAVIQGRRQK